MSEDKEKIYDSIGSGILEALTEKAIKVDLTTKHAVKERHVWIPRGVVEDGYDLGENDIGERLEFFVESWFVEREGL